MIFKKISIILVMLIGYSTFLTVEEIKAEDYREATVTGEVYEETTVTSEVYENVVLDVPKLFAKTSSIETITSSRTIGDGTYQLASAFKGRVTIANTATNVKIIGSGTQNLSSDIVFESDRTGPIVLTIEDLNIMGVTAHGIDFTNAGNFDNRLYISGENIVIGLATGERVIIVMGALNALESKVSGTLNRYISRIT
jgi:hypothetical protein